ncbi:hypothetical protein QZH41_010764 [Actinostola sp. cb2023]|nr:hypothetical protein QZH41_010764 [Actinostola sp. cb2023]
MGMGRVGRVVVDWGGLVYLCTMADDSNQFKTMITFDCRGVEPTAFSPRVSYRLPTGFVAEGAETSSKFTDINLSEMDWSDYDEKAKLSVGIYEVTSQFVKAHA